MNYNQTPVDIKKTVKKGCILLLVAFPFVLACAVCLKIIGAPVWAILLCNVVVGGIVVFIEIIILNKIKEKREKANENKPKEFDPFKD